jgi:CheY-like chemotaxis protein
LKGRPLSILLVENHEDTLAYLCRHLEGSGHSVTVARTSAESEAAAKQSPHDVLLCDIGLPDDNGWNLLSKLGRSRPSFCIAISGYGMAQDVQRSREAGFHHHLTKPFLPSELEALLALA